VPDNCIFILTSEHHSDVSENRSPYLGFVFGFSASAALLRFRTSGEWNWRNRDARRRWRRNLYGLDTRTRRFQDPEHGELSRWRKSCKVFQTSGLLAAHGQSLSDWRSHHPGDADRNCAPAFRRKCFCHQRQISSQSRRPLAIHAGNRQALRTWPDNVERRTLRCFTEHFGGAYLPAEIARRIQRLAACLCCVQLGRRQCSPRD